MTQDTAITKFCGEQAAKGLLTKEQELAEFAKIRAGDAKARDEMIARNLRLAAKAARRYSRISGISFADLYQEGSIGVMTAVDKFDPEKDCKFSTYATNWIKQRVSRYAKKHSRNVFVPEHVCNLAAQAEAARAKLLQDGVESPGDREIAAEVSRTHKGAARTAAAVRDAVESCQQETSIFAKVGEDAEVGDFLEDEKTPDPAAEADRREADGRIASALRGLAPEERVVVALKFGIDPYRGRLPASELARMFRTTPAEIAKAGAAGLIALGVPAEEAARIAAA